MDTRWRSSAYCLFHPVIPPRVLQTPHPHRKHRHISFSITSFFRPLRTNPNKCLPLIPVSVWCILLNSINLLNPYCTTYLLSSYFRSNFQSFFTADSPMFHLFSFPCLFLRLIHLLLSPSNGMGGSECFYFVNYHFFFSTAASWKNISSEHTNMQMCI